MAEIRLRFVVYGLGEQTYSKVVAEGERFLKPKGAKNLIDITKSGASGTLLQELVSNAVSKARLLGLDPSQIDSIQAIA